MTREQPGKSDRAAPAPSDQESVQYIRDWAGIHSDTAIARQLNEWGLRDPKGRRWDNKRVRQVDDANAHILPTFHTKPTGKNILNELVSDGLPEGIDPLGRKPLTAVQSRAIRRWHGFK